MLPSLHLLNVHPMRTIPVSLSIILALGSCGGSPDNNGGAAASGGGTPDNRPLDPRPGAGSTPPADLALTSSNRALLDFGGSPFHLGSVQSGGGRWDIQLSGPRTGSPTERAPFILRVLLPEVTGDGTHDVAAPSDLEQTSWNQIDAAHVLVLESRADFRLGPPSYAALSGSIQIANYAYDEDAAPLDRHRFEVTLDVEVKAVDRDGDTPTLAGDSARLSGSFPIGPE